MLTRICDRCGKVIESGPEVNLYTTKHMSIFTIQLGPFEKRTDPNINVKYYVSKRERITGDLCKECTDAFYIWYGKESPDV